MASSSVFDRCSHSYDARSGPVVLNLFLLLDSNRYPKASRKAIAWDTLSHAIIFLLVKPRITPLTGLQRIATPKFNLTVFQKAVSGADGIVINRCVDMEQLKKI